MLFMALASPQPDDLGMDSLSAPSLKKHNCRRSPSSRERAIRLGLRVLCIFALVGGGVATRVVAAPASPDVADPVIAYHHQQDLDCGWAGVRVRPITSGFAQSIGMVQPYGAIFRRARPGGPAAPAGIQADDVVTAINGSPLGRATDFGAIISRQAPGTTVYLRAWRDSQVIEVALVLGAAKCPRPPGRSN
jgi:S1-C subfamily serine protease